MVNIYNANGSLTSNRTLTQSGFSLRFNGTNQSTVFDVNNGIYQNGIAGIKRASITLTSNDNNSDGVSSSMQLFQDPEQISQIIAGNDSRGLSIGTSFTTQPTPITFITNTGNTNGIERMRITPTGSVGVNTQTPTEKFDNNGITRLRTLPLNGATNAIFTMPDGNSASATQNQTFTATKTVVADANGILGYVDGIPSGAGTSKIFVSAGVLGTQNISGGTNILGNFSVEHIDTNNAWTSNVFTVPASLGGIFIVSMQTSNTHTVEASSWFTIARLQKSTDGGGSWQNLLQDTQSNKLGTDVDNGNHLYWTGSLNANDRVRIIFQCNATANNIVSLGSLTITKINQ